MEEEDRWDRRDCRRRRVDGAIGRFREDKGTKEKCREKEKENTGTRRRRRKRRKGSRFGETFAVALDISKAFDRIWHKALLSKLPSCGFHLAHCFSLLVSFPVVLLLP